MNTRTAREIRRAIRDARNRRWPSWIWTNNKYAPSGPNIVYGGWTYREAFERASSKVPPPQPPRGPSGVSHAH